MKANADLQQRKKRSTKVWDPQVHIDDALHTEISTHWNCADHDWIHSYSCDDSLYSSIITLGASIFLDILANSSIWDAFALASSGAPLVIVRPTCWRFASFSRPLDPLQHSELQLKPLKFWHCPIQVVERWQHWCVNRVIQSMFKMLEGIYGV